LHEAVLREQLAQQLEPAAVVEPGILLAGIQAEGEAGLEAKGRVLAEIEGGQGMAGLDGAGLRCVEHLQRRHDLVGRKDLDLELPFGELADAFGHVFDAALDGVEALRPAGGEAPPDAGTGLRNGRAGDCAGYADGCRLEELAPFHARLPSGLTNLTLTGEAAFFLRGGRGTRQRPGKLCSYTD
jgi:hypothetical protein